MKKILSVCLLSGSALLPGLLIQNINAAEEDRFSKIEIKAQQASEHIYMLTGSGGNIGLSIGQDGTLIVDDQYLPLAKRILASIDQLGGDKPKLILNTHHHGDHTGGNSQFGRDGTIIAHSNVRLRLMDNEQVDAFSLPLITFDDRIQLHFNNDDIEIIHLPHGHTDGDAIVWFKNSKVVHLGDLFFNGRFPYIDIDSGGSLQGLSSDIEKILQWISADTTVIPGHGKLASVKDLESYLAMLQYSENLIQMQINRGTSMDDIIAGGVDAKYAGWGGGFINTERWIQMVYTSLTQGSK